MGKLRFKIGGVEFEYIGEPAEIERFVQRLLSSAIQIVPSQTRLTSETEPPVTSLIPPSQSKFTEHGQMVLPLPNDMEVKQYVLGKPDYRHNIFEIQQRFFHRRFKSRGETRHMYHKSARQLRKIREEIETEQGGKFEESIGKGGAKEFVFKRGKDVLIV